MTRKFVWAVIAVFIFAITGCGSGVGGATVKPLSSTLSATNTAVKVVSPPTTDYFVDLTVTADPYAPSFVASMVKISKVEIVYTKTSNSSSNAPSTLPVQPGPTGQIPAGGGSITLNLPVASKAFLSQLGFTPDSGEIWEYYVTYKVTADEHATGRDLSFTTGSGNRISFN